MKQLSHILCIDDEEDILEIAQFALETVGGYRVSTCVGGQKACAGLGEREAPDLILLDVMMPGMNGPETLRKLQTSERFSDVPVVFMTAKVQPSEVAHLRELGAASVIAKPFDPMTLPDQLEKIWSAYHGAG